MRVLRSHLWGLGGIGALSLPLLAGCGGGGGGGDSTPPPPPAALSVTGTTAHGLTVTLSENTATLAAGGSVVYTSTLKNNTASAVTVMETSATPTAPAATLTVKDPAGTTVNLGTPPGAPPLYNFALLPGQSLTVTQTVTAFGTRGTYNATSTFADDPSGAVAIGPLALTVQ